MIRFSKKKFNIHRISVLRRCINYIFISECSFQWNTKNLSFIIFQIFSTVNSGDPFSLGIPNICSYTHVANVKFNIYTLALWWWHMNQWMNSALVNVCFILSARIWISVWMCECAGTWHQAHCIIAIAIVSSFESKSSWAGKYVNVSVYFNTF